MGKCLNRVQPICYSKMFSTSGNNSVVECDLAKVEVAGSNPVSRSNFESARTIAGPRAFRSTRFYLEPVPSRRPSLSAVSIDAAGIPL